MLKAQIWKGHSVVLGEHIATRCRTLSGLEGTWGFLVDMFFTILGETHRNP